MLQSHIPRHRPIRVRQPLRKRKTRARRSQRPKSELSQIAGRADIPRIRDDETAAFMQLPENRPPRAEVGTHVFHRFPQSLQILFEAVATIGKPRINKVRKAPLLSRKYSVLWLPQTGQALT